LSNVVEFRRPEPKKGEPTPKGRSLAEFAVVMAVLGLAFFLLPTIWSSVPQEMLAVIHLLVAVVYLAQGLRVVAGIWIAATVVCLGLTGAPSPVTYALSYGAGAFDQAIAP